MSKVLIIHRKRLQTYGVLAAVVILAGAYLGWQSTKAAPSVPAMAAANGPQVIQLVTGEFKAMTDDGRELESYVFNPGTVFAKKGQPVELRISGVNGQSHPFVIEGLNIKGEVKKGKTTIVNFTPQQAGIYPIICQIHDVPKNGGPMVGYLVVQ